MYPVLAFPWGGGWVAISSYRLFMGLGAIATLGLAFWLASRRELPLRKVAFTLVVMAFCVPIGARLLDVVTKSDLYLRQPEAVLSLELSGFSLYGGLFLASAAGVLLCRLFSLDLLRMADTAAPALGLGIATMRVGCFLAGCSFGTVADLPWAVTFPVGSDVHLYQVLHGGLFVSGFQANPVHPTQLYESLAGLTAAALAVWVLRKNTLSGAAFAASAVWFNAFRLGNGFLRVQENPLAMPAGFYPALYVALVCAGGIWLLWRFASPKRSAEGSRSRGPATMSATS